MKLLPWLAAACFVPSLLPAAEPPVPPTLDIEALQTVAKEFKTLEEFQDNLLLLIHGGTLTVKQPEARNPEEK